MPMVFSSSMDNQKPRHGFLFKLDEPGKVVTDFQNLTGDVDMLSATGTMSVFLKKEQIQVIKE